jgi:hypothetical protein
MHLVTGLTHIASNLIFATNAGQCLPLSASLLLMLSALSTINTLGRCISMPLPAYLLNYSESNATLKSIYRT